MCGDDRAFTVRVKLWPSCSPKDLKHVQDTKVNKRTLLSIVDLSALGGKKGNYIITKW